VSSRYDSHKFEESSNKMATYGSIPKTEGEHASPTPASSNKKKGMIASLAAVLLAGGGAVAFLRSPVEKEVICPESQTAEVTEAWPSELFAAGNSKGLYGGTGALGEGSFHQAGRPTTTKEATAEGWKKISDSECDPNLGNPWAFNGEITVGGPVTLYFSKETDCFDGILTGIGVHYFNGAAPTKMVEDFIFSKGEDYDTVNIALRNQDTDVCGEGLLPSNTPVLDVILAGGKGRKSVPVTEVDAKASGEWKAGGCVKGMGIHWEHDIVGGSNFTFKAENWFPVVPMYDEKDGSVNGVFFQAPKKMQIWDDACGFGLSKCYPLTNMWDAGPAGIANGVNPFAMANNFCGVFPGITGAENNVFTTMHFFFKKTIPECMRKCPVDNPTIFV